MANRPSARIVFVEHRLRADGFGESVFRMSNPTGQTLYFRGFGAEEPVPYLRVTTLRECLQREFSYFRWGRLYRSVDELLATVSHPCVSSVTCLLLARQQSVRCPVGSDSVGLAHHIGPRSSLPLLCVGHLAQARLVVQCAGRSGGLWPRAQERLQNGLTSIGSVLFGKGLRVAASPAFRGGSGRRRFATWFEREGQGRRVVMTSRAVHGLGSPTC